MPKHLCPEAWIYPAILIPSHKPDLSPEEKISLVHCQKFLGHYSVYLLCPDGMPTETYDAIFPSLNKLTVPPEKMANISAYNKLMISPFIFDSLQSHTHILIHEPDALVLRDELKFWCQQDFDYIGAPWFTSDAPDDLTLKATGNYGLSLFKTKAAKDLFSKNPRWYSWTMIARDFIRGVRGKNGYLRKALLGLGSQGHLANAYAIYQDHCDIFWSYLIPKVAPHFRIAPPASAIFFAWEKNPEKCIQVCRGELPFGMHAWSKYDLEFLKPLFVKAGITLG